MEITFLDEEIEILKLKTEVNNIYNLELRSESKNTKNYYRTLRMNKEIEINSLQEKVYDKKINIDNDNYIIKIKDSTHNLKDWMMCLEKTISNGQCLPMLVEDIDNLEEIFENDPTANYTFPSNERIYYSKDKIEYLPNAHSKEEKEKIFDIMKEHLEEAKKYFISGTE